MMKAFLACLLVTLAVGQTTNICLPNVFQWRTSEEWLGFNRRTGGYELSSNWFDYNQQKFKSLTFRYVGTEQYFTEVLVWGKSNKMWIVQGKQGGGTITCTEHSVSMPPSTPCLLPNAHHRGHWYIAGDVRVQVWNQNGTRDNVQYYQEISIAEGNNAPVVMRSAEQHGNMTFTIFYDYTINVSPSSFNIPTLCPGSLLKGADMAKKDIAKIFPHLRFAQ